MSTLLGGLTPQEFLASYWQKKPLFIRGALPGFQDPLSPDELAGLAMEPEIKARLVFEKGKRPWRLYHGPFSEQKLRRLPKSHWSLLVSRVNEYCEDAARLLDRFSFIPHWRCEDLMVSFAPPMGTVGAHVDSYDVFLIQGKGTRRWQIQHQPNPDLIPDLDLKILKHFDADEEWVLEPGDMLYLPPGVAHFGVALTDCMTYSVGFRAPSHGALWRALFQLPENLLSSLDGERLYGDPDLLVQENPGLLSEAAVSALIDILAEPLKQRSVMERWLGAFLTQSESPSSAPPKSRPSPARLAEKLKKSHVWRADDVRLLYLKPQDNRFSVFVAGDEHSLDLCLLPLMERLTQSREVSGQTLLGLLPRGSHRREGGLEFLGELMRLGAITLAPKPR